MIEFNSLAQSPNFADENLDEEKKFECRVSEEGRSQGAMSWMVAMN